MSDNSGQPASRENNRIGPDFFGFYASEVAELLSQDEGLFPFSQQVYNLSGNFDEVGREKGASNSSCRTKENNGTFGSASQCTDGVGALLSECRKERLKSLLRHSVFTLTREVDEMIDPILSVCRIRSCLRCKETLLGLDASAPKAHQPRDRHKKRKVLSDSMDLESEHMVPANRLTKVIVKKCTQCHATGTPQWRTTADGKCLCNACGLKYLKDLKNGSAMNLEAGKESIEIDDDLRFILENDSTKVDELMQKHAGEFAATLERMEQKLEELLNSVMATCRPMTISEKQQLRKSIQSLPPRNLDRVVEIIEQNKPSLKHSSDSVRVDLSEQDNVTLWRLYFYIKTIQS